jgi:thiol-disulfide isomerase/thioredoxin
MNRRMFLATTLALSVLSPGLAFADDVGIAIQSGGPVLVHVTAPWCKTCQAQKPIVADLLAKPDFKPLRKIDVDFDTQKDVLAKLRVTTQSTMIVFKDGKEIDRQVGQTDPAEIEALFRKAL